MTIEASPTPYSRKARAAELASPWIVLRTSRSNGGLETCSTERRQTKKKKSPPTALGKDTEYPERAINFLKNFLSHAFPKQGQPGVRRTS
ncbi:unnamed protein product [Ixodes persulcatus]